MSAVLVIAATFSSDVAGIREYRYQPTKTRQAIYAIGDFYYTCSKGVPKDKGYTWTRHHDQLWAQYYKTVLWVSPITD